MGAQGSVVDNDVIDALCSDDPATKCTTIKPNDIREIAIDREAIKDVRNIVRIIPMAGYLRRVKVTASLHDPKLVYELASCILARGRLLDLLDLSGNRIDLETAKQIRAIMENKKVGRIILRSCGMENTVFFQICEGFRRGHPTVSELDVQGNEVSPKLLIFNLDVFQNAAVKWSRWDEEAGTSASRNFNDLMCN